MDTTHYIETCCYCAFDIEWERIKLEGGTPFWSQSSTPCKCECECVPCESCGDRSYLHEGILTCEIHGDYLVCFGCCDCYDAICPKCKKVYSSSVVSSVV